MIQARCSRRRRIPARTLPSVQPDVMVVSASAQESRLTSHLLLKLEPKNSAVERDAPIKIGNLQVDMPNTNSGRDWLAHRSGSPQGFFEFRRIGRNTQAVTRRQNAGNAGSQ